MSQHPNMHAFLVAPAGLGKLRARGWAWLVVYVALCAAVLTLVARWIVAHQHDARELLVGYLFPAGWRFAGDLLIDRFFAAQERAVLVNAAIAGSLLVVQVTLFPVKEQLSAAAENSAFSSTAVAMVASRSASTASVSSSSCTVLPTSKPRARRASAWPSLITAWAVMVPSGFTCAA